MSKEKLFNVGVKALIENPENKILLLHSPGWEKNGIPPHWDIPGGRIQEGQSVQEALVREIEEETGITEVSDITFFTGVIANHEIPYQDRMLGLVLMIYKLKIPVDSKITLSDEHVAYEWLNPQEAAKRLENKYPKEFITTLL